MGHLFLALVITASTGLFAQPKATDLTDEEIKEILLTDVYEIVTGDDGKECQAEIGDLIRIGKTSREILVHYRALRDVAEHGCAPAEIRCASKIIHSAYNNWKVESLCL